jgi:cell division protein FtsI (penicillin-binding protein 3)
MNPAAHPQLSLRLPAWRTRFVFALFAIAFAVLVLRALYLQGMLRDFLQGKGDASSTSRPLVLQAHRGMVTDRHGELLAISTPVESVWATPDDVDITPTQRERLARLLGMEPGELTARLAGRGKNFVYLKRHLPPEQAAKVVKLDLPGIFLQREYRRYYPAGDSLAHVLGFTDVDDKGQEGLELAYEGWLAGQPGSRRVIRDRPGRVVEDVASIKVPQEGRDLQLSIDLKLQYLAYRELKAAVSLHQAKAGGIVVLDVKTGEVLALANVPTYNPNNRTRYDAMRARNRALTDLFEPGSTLKPFTVAAALESGMFRADSMIATAGGSLTLGPATIRDAHVSAINLTVAQVIQRSSNVGTAKMALALPAQQLWAMFNAAGFGAPPHSGFPGEAGGRLRDYRTWRPIEQATMSYGHGISVSLMQLVRAYTIFCGNGELLPVTLVRRDDSVAGMSVISPETAAILRHMMQLVTEPGGTAPRAQVLGYHVAGKTGTAHKLVNGQYAPDRYASSFIGFAPASDPRLLIAVMIDEPSAGEYYGGVVAAPVFSAVMSGALRMLSIPPDMPVIRKGPIDEIPEVAEEV